MKKSVLDSRPCTMGVQFGVDESTFLCAIFHFVDAICHLRAK